MRKYLLLIFCAITVSFAFSQPITGIKTIPGDYPTIASAVNMLNINGTAAPGVTFNVASGYLENGLNITLSTTTSNAAAPIVFQKAAGAAVNPKIYGSAGSAYGNDGIIIIAGSDYVTFDGIDVNASDNTVDWGYALIKKNSAAPFDGCQNVTIRSCNINMNRGNGNAFGIYSGNHVFANTTSLTITSATDACNNCRFYGNNISNVLFGVNLNGFNAPSPYTLYDQNNQVGVDAPNIITNCGGGYTSSAIYAQYQNGIDISNNVISSGAITAAPSISVTGITLVNGNNASGNISNNSISISFSNGGTQTLYGIYLNFGTPGTTNTLNINNNTISNCTIGAVGNPSFYGIFNAISYQGPANLNMNNNSIHDITLPGAGNVYAMDGGFAANISMNGNSIYNLTLSGSPTVYLLKAGTGTVVQHDNLIHDVTVGSGNNLLCGMYNYANPTSETYYNNQVYNLFHNGNGLVYGMYYYTTSGTRQAYANVVHTLTSNGGVVYGMYWGSSSPNIYKNKVYDLTSYTAAGQVYGMYMYTGNNAFIYNNYISDLKTPASTSTSAISGLYIYFSNPTYIYYNTIFLNATSSSVTTFGTAALNVANNNNTVDLKNNILVNTSTPVAVTAPAYTVAYQRGQTSYSNYTTTSNNNCFYAGAPGPNNLVYYDGTNADQSLALFKALVTPRESASVSELPPFVDTAGHNFHIQTGINTFVESGGQRITTPVAITNDFDGDVRWGETGYAGTGSAPDIGADEGNFNSVTAMGYQASVTEQVGGTTFSGTTNQQVIRIKVSVSGGSAPMTITQFTVNAAGTTAITDINAAPSKIWFTGNSSYYGPGIQFGTAVPTIANYTISGSQVLSPGDNYFWLVYDVIQTAQTAHVIDGQCVNFTIAGNSVVPSVTDPVGSTMILGPMSGTYLVGAGNVYPNFVTITDAINNLNHRGTGGPVTFSLTNPSTTPYNSANGETFPITVGVIPLSTAVNNVTVQPAAGVSPVISGSSATSILKLNGTDFFTVNGSNSGGTTRDLLIENTSTAHLTCCVQMNSLGTGAGCIYDTFKNCIIRSGTTGGNSAYTYAFSCGSGIGNTGEDNHNLTLDNNEISRAYYALYLGGTYNMTDNLTVSNNTIGSDDPTCYVGYIGIYGSYIQGILNNNVIKGIVTSTTTTRGIYFGPGVKNTLVTRNDIHAILGVTGSSNNGVGIEVDLASYGNNVTIANNLIYNISGDGSANLYSYGIAGIKIDGISTNVKIYHNTINLYGQINKSTATADASAAIFVWSSASQIDIRNNILTNSLENVTGVSKAYGIYTPAASSVFTAIDYNDYYITGREAVFAYFGSADVLTLADWQTATGKDANSIASDPNFNSPTSVVPYPGSAELDKCPLLSITDDFTGAARTAPVSMGAYENGNDVTPQVVTYTPLPNTHLTTVRTLTATISDSFSTVPNSGAGMPRLYWRINNNGWNISNGVWNNGNTYQFTFGNSVTTGDQVSYFIVCQDNMPTPNVGATPSAGAAGFSSNPPAAITAPSNPSTYTIVPGISGIKNIPGDYPNLTGATGFFADMNSKTLTGNLTVKITGNLSEDGTTALNEVNTEDPAYKLSIVNSGNYHSISGSYSGALIRFNGADNVTLNGKGKLMIANNMSTPSIALGLSGGCNNNIIDSCNFAAGYMFWSSSNYGIYFTGPGNNNMFRYDSIYRCYMGIYMNPGYWGMSSGNVVYRNVIGSGNSSNYIGNNGIFLQYQDNALVSRNQVFNIITTGSPIAIYAEGVTNSIIEKNDIHDIVYNGSSYGGASGITSRSLNANPNLTIRNNLIRHITGMGNSPNTGDYNNIPAGIKLFGNSTSGLNIYYNSVYLTRDASYGLFFNNEWFTALEISAGVSGINLKNNILQNSVGEDANATITTWGYSVYTKGAASPFSSINNNLYFTSNADNNFVGLRGTAVPPVNNMNLADWKTFTTQDGASINADPLFTSTTNLTLQALSPAIGAGLAMPGVVDDDFNGNIRGTSTTIGAIEMAPYSTFPNRYAVTGGGTYCQETGGLPVGMANSQTGVTYTLYLNGSATGITFSGSGASFNFSGNQPAGTYTVMATNSNGSIFMLNSVVVSMNPSPVPTITGSALVCSGSAGIPYTTESSMTNYTWNVNGGTIAAGAGTNSITVNWGTGSSGNITLNYINGNQCTSPTPTSKAITLAVPPVSSQTLTNITVGSGQTPCKDATQTITVAGNGTTYTVAAGGNSHLVAGVSVSMLPGTTVISGGYLHAYIANDCFYCNAPKSSFVSGNTQSDETGQPESSAQATREIRIYPNPASGMVTLEFPETIEGQTADLQIYNLAGVMVMKTRVAVVQKQMLDLTGIASGMYLLRISVVGMTWNSKILKQ